MVTCFLLVGRTVESAVYVDNALFKDNPSAHLQIPPSDALTPFTGKIRSVAIVKGRGPFFPRGNCALLATHNNTT